MVDRSELKQVDEAFAYNGNVNFLTLHLSNYLDEMNSCLAELDEMLSEGGLSGIDHHNFSEDILYCADMFSELLNYSGRAAYKAKELIDEPLYKNFNLHATESISRIRLEDYSIENNLGIKENVDTGRGVYEKNKPSLSIRDFLGLSLPETGGMLTAIPEEFRQFTDFYAEHYERFKDRLIDEDGNPISLEVYLEGLINSGEFYHSMNQPLRSFLNVLTDMTVIIPIIEACCGEEFITGEDLSDRDRGMKYVDAAVSVFSLGMSSLYIRAASNTTAEIVKNSCKVILIDAASTSASYWTGYACDELGVPVPLTYTLALSVGTLTASSLNEKFLWNATSEHNIVVQRTIDSPDICDLDLEYSSYDIGVNNSPTAPLNSNNETFRLNDNLVGSERNTGTVWDCIYPTQENYTDSYIPKSFSMDANGQMVWVNGNATEHIYNDVYSHCLSVNGSIMTSDDLYTQLLLSDFYGSVSEATQSGITYGRVITQGNWDFVFARPRQIGQFPVLKHAQFNGWH